MNYVNDKEVREIVRSALNEDIGRGDITTKFAIRKDIKIEAAIMAKDPGIVCGMDICGLVFKSLDRDIKYRPLVKDGAKVKKGRVLAKVWGPARSILTAERVALNFLGFLSGIATQTAEFVQKAGPYNLKIMDTRKTIPGLRKLEKYAVKAGGGWNHRYSLDQMVLIKDNHLKIMEAVAGCGHRGILELMGELRKKVPRNTKIEVEVKNLKQFREAVSAGPDIIMLDNMPVSEIKQAVRTRNSLTPRCSGLFPKLEASGNITLKNITGYLACGIDFISLGTLTKDVKSLDLSLKVKRVGI